MTMTANNPTESVSLNGKSATTKNILKSVARQKSSESRKVRKPLMEKKRRARINHSLNELKRILLEANGTPSRKEGNRPAKLEKADILELTVQHLQSLQTAKATDPQTEPLPRVPVTSSTTSISDMDVDEESSSSSTASFAQEIVKPAPNKLAVLTSENPNHAFSSIKQENNTYLVPTRLSNGDIAFVLKRSGNKLSTFSETRTTSMEIKCEEQSEIEFYSVEDNNNLKSSSRSSDNHNRVYLHHTIISSNNDNHRVLWRPW